MRMILTLICALALFPTTAEAWVKHIDAPAESVVRWTTPQWFAWTDNTVFKVRVNGHTLNHGYKYQRRRDCGIGWSAREAVVEAQMPCGGRHSVTIETANMRERAIHVRVSYWVPTPAPGGEKG